MATTIEELRAEIQESIEFATEEFNDKNKTQFTAPEQLSDKQIVSMVRQAYRQRLHTQSFQKKNRTMYQAAMKKLRDKGIDVDAILNDAQVE
jgi:hypothetical protein